MNSLMRFALGLILELYRISSLPIGEGYSPTSFYYTRRSWREEGDGVYGKGLRLKSNVRIQAINIDDGVGEVDAEVLSESGIKRYKVRITIPLDFECNCPWGSHRFNPCKHVYAATLRILEDAGIDIRDGILEFIVYEGLNRLAYHKARIATSIA